MLDNEAFYSQNIISYEIHQFLIAFHAISKYTIQNSNLGVVERDQIVWFCCFDIWMIVKESIQMINIFLNDSFKTIGFHFLLLTSLDGNGNGAISRTYFHSNDPIFRTGFQSRHFGKMGAENYFAKNILLRNGVHSSAFNCVNIVGLGSRKSGSILYKK